MGGILEAKKMAGMPEAYYGQIGPHLYCGPIEAAANIPLDTCSPNYLIQESIERFDGFHAEVLKKPLEWEDGYIIPPTAPALGVVAAHPFQGCALASRFLPGKPSNVPSLDAVRVLVPTINHLRVGKLQHNSLPPGVNPGKVTARDRT